MLAILIHRHKDLSLTSQLWASLVAQAIKTLSAMPKIWV